MSGKIPVRIIVFIKWHICGAILGLSFFSILLFIESYPVLFELFEIFNQANCIFY